MNVQQSQNMIKSVLQKAQEAARADSSPGHVMSVLENLSPDIKNRLGNNQMWQSLKAKTPREIEQSAANLMRDQSTVTNVIGAINPEMGEKVSKSPVLSALCRKSLGDMGGFVIKLAHTMGFIK